MLTTVEFTDDSMKFELSDGNFIHIRKEDVTRIITSIVVEGSLKKQVIFCKPEDHGIEKADRLYQVLKSYPDMDIKLKNKYLTQISELLSSNETIYKGAHGEEFILKELEVINNK